MKLTEAEMRMVFQIESTNQNAALNEIYMTWRYAPNPAAKETAEGLLDKLRPLSDQECMDLIRKVQAEYRLPEKARTIGEMLAEARQQSGAQKLSGHDIMALERFDPATRHMIVFDVLTHDSPVGWKGEKMRLFLTDTGYSKALGNQEKGHIKIRSHAKVLSGDLHYDHKGRERYAERTTPEKPSIRERLEDAKRECAEHKPQEGKKPGRDVPEHDCL